MANDDSSVLRDVSSVWRVWVSDWDVEISPGRAAFLAVWVDERLRVCPCKVVSSDWSVSVVVCEVEINPGSSAFLDVCAGERFRVRPCSVESSDCSPVRKLCLVWINPGRAASLSRFGARDDCKVLRFVSSVWSVCVEV